ncbi:MULTISPECIES: sigma-70 family RNA polymerase sigma factor [Sorangium]|uniref:Uncharacterized protein n=1 Tax=Sorangium cellulosum TaxID=56 RepID=A0A4P2QML1_SORCE|nr:MULTISPECIES: sigma-70 family RNA polymerase sigma factor [Sorangium]AUX31270.1 hypothetical protein SOCE836_033990 [Sorangium cellulosum]WCQ90654.1 hypothetical protein NQZ70_03365 [Sorangium sp. Soce836]
MNTLPEPFASRPELLVPENYPALGTVSSASFYKLVVVPRTPPPPPQYVFVPVKRSDDAAWVALSQWNLMWEWGTVRPEDFHERLPEHVVSIIDRHADANFRLVPFVGEEDRLSCYEPLYSLLPRATLDRFGLPPRRGTWPMLAPAWERTNVPHRIERLSQALAFHLWPLLCPRSSMSAFDKNEPVRLLAHCLDFWLPYVDVVAQRRVQALGRVPFENDQQRRDQEELQRVVERELNADARRPCYGGHVWRGEDDARDAAKELIEAADEHGKLRDLVDAIESNRVQDDFSPRWSHVKEDFERKLYRKRSKTKVVFVELDETVPVHAPDVEVEVERSLLWQHLFTMLNERERRVIVCLRNGFTTATEIAAELGYANHSPVSKALASVRKKAHRHLK